MNDEVNTQEPSTAAQGGAESAAQSNGEALLDEQAQPAALEDLVSETNGEGTANIDSILDIPVTLAMEIGRTQINIKNLLQLNKGSVVALDRLAGEPLDVLVNGTLVAHGEVVVVNEKFGIRLTDVISAQDRLKQLK